ncbi:hypothetical protein GWI33_017797 [Rhynchophorus ferrugineus]|uniref:Uncharacterized protein n=1 Tax=Rhynchophorus ferrugineus TaxID=354439 RepID=A0A834HUR1_RHYFE|nr:hypothetical protein GWI33_017797 [Rhynchophorus ferrugineus]
MRKKKHDNRAKESNSLFSALGSLRTPGGRAGEGGWWCGTATREKMDLGIGRADPLIENDISRHVREIFSLFELDIDDKSFGSDGIYQTDKSIC